MTDLELELVAGHIGNQLGLLPDHTWTGWGVGLGVAGDGLYIERASATHITVSGRAPDVTPHWRVSGKPKPVNCAISRGPAAIARDIKRRYLSAYRDWATRVREQAAREQAEQEARDKLTSLIWGLFPPDKVSAPSHLQTSSRAELVIYLAGHQGGYVKVSHDASEVEFERFRMPPHVALVMLEAAAQMTRQED